MATKKALLGGTTSRTGNVVSLNVVKHVNRIRIGRRVVVRNSGNRNTNRKILSKQRIKDRKRIVIQNRRIVTSKIITKFVIMTDNST
jgi:hypothetical protein